ncbi:CAP domain-containing protein [Actinomadura rifamycini]|uniref:CAP domain-containing protein n=1 Tax=Actinomadura rifamycini TaxID=31962 RepID=UPI000412F297|nr:CAP domain-containing protein [Actinomadura rifamycini]
MRERDGRGPRRASERVVVWTAVGAAGLLVAGAVAGTVVGLVRDEPDRTLAGHAGTPSPAPTAPRSTAPASPQPSRTAPEPTSRKTREPVQRESRAPERARTSAPARPTRTSEPRRSARPVPAGGTVAARVVALVNDARAGAGCGPVRSNALLVRAAQGHSADMAARGFFDHTSPDGDGPGDRITSAGYRWSTYGENIAKGQSGPESVMKSWMNSPGHRANILNCKFDEIGVGVVESGGPYWTQVFGAR